MLIGIDCRLWNETGIGRYVRNLVWNLAKIDHKNKYLLFFKDNEFRNVELPGKNFEKKLADVHWHSIGEQISLAGILKKEKMDLVHFPYFSIPVNYNLPFVITIHDLIINHFPTGKASTRMPIIYWLKLFAYKFILFSAIKKSKTIIAVSNATKKEIIDHYHVSEGKIHVTYEGVDDRIYSKIYDKPIIEGKYFLYVGNAYPHKNLERLIFAFKNFKERAENSSKLVLVGKQDFFYARLKQTVEKLNIPEVLFYEKISDAGLSNLYANATALVSPSLMEGFGLPVVEAMSSGCPVAVSDIDVYREICADNAVYFDPKSIESIQDVLTKIYSGSIKDIEKLRKNGMLRAKKFSWENMARQTLKIYESSIGIRQSQ